MADTDYMNADQARVLQVRLDSCTADISECGPDDENLRETVIVPDPADARRIEEEHALELRTRDANASC